jgi:hypothetical protein
MLALEHVDEFPQFEVKRADTISDPGMIDAQVINALLNADLVIADLSTLNPNAFYEIGIRHMVQKPIIHMQVIEETIPFDVSLFRSIKYSRLRPRDLRNARIALKVQIEAILAPGYQVDNPVTRTRGAVALEQGATPGERVLLEQIRSLESRLASLENGFPTSTKPSSKAYPWEGLGMSTLTFRNRGGLTDKQVETIEKPSTAQFGVATPIARNKSSLVVGVMGAPNPEKIILPRSVDMHGIEFQWSSNPTLPS